MNNKTKKIFIFSTITVFTTAAVLAFVVFKIQSQGLRLEDQLNVLEDNNKKETNYFALKKLVTNTESERVALASSFFKDEGDSINFLGEIESLANSVGLSLKINTLTPQLDKETNQESVGVEFTYIGQKDLVLNFTKLMEVTPHHSKIESLSVKKITEKEWEGNMSISITVNSQ